MVVVVIGGRGVCCVAVQISDRCVVAGVEERIGGVGDGGHGGHGARVGAGAAAAAARIVLVVVVVVVMVVVVVVAAIDPRLVARVARVASRRRAAARARELILIGQADRLVLRVANVAVGVCGGAAVVVGASVAAVVVGQARGGGQVEVGDGEVVEEARGQRGGVQAGRALVAAAATAVEASAVGAFAG